MHQESFSHRERPPRMPQVFSRRGRNHDAAHDLPDPLEPPRDRSSHRHPLVPAGAPQIVQTQPALNALIQTLRAAGSFAYDSEFIGELTYIPKLCLMQVAWPDGISLIDPLAPVDLGSFWELMCDPAVEKVVHAGQQDLEPVVRHLDRRAANLFDTQVAAGFVGMGYPVSLTRIVQELLDVRLGKSLTFTHWDRRPLSPSQIGYAADDVRFLLALRQELGRRLEERSVAAWSAEECDALCDPSLYRFNADQQAMRVRSSSSLSQQGWAVLRELVIWRDAAARAHDLPPRTMLKDEVMIDLARSPVKIVEKLSRVRGLPRPVEQAHGAEIVEAVRRGLEVPLESLPPLKQVDMAPTQRFSADALWAAAQSLCVGQGLDPALVTSRQEITDLLHHAQQNRDRVDNQVQLRILQGWRRRALGQPLLDLMDGKAHIRLEWSDQGLKAVVVPLSPDKA
jgi:ribonuclease D